MILTPAVPPPARPSNPPCPRGPRKSAGAWEQEGSPPNLRDALLKYCWSNLFSRSARPGDEESVIERVRKEGDFKYYSKGKKNTTTRCSNCRRCKGQRATNADQQATLRKGNQVLKVSFEHCSRTAGNGVSSGWMLTSTQGRTAPLDEREGWDVFTLGHCQYSS